MYEPSLEQKNTQRIGVSNAVRIGGVSRAALGESLRDHYIQLNQAAEALFVDERFETSSRTEVIEIVSVSVADLGFLEGARYGEIIAPESYVAVARGRDPVTNFWH